VFLSHVCILRHENDPFDLVDGFANHESRIDWWQHHRHRTQIRISRPPQRSMRSRATCSSSCMSTKRRVGMGSTISLHWRLRMYRQWQRSELSSTRQLLRNRSDPKKLAFCRAECLDLSRILFSCSSDRPEVFIWLSNESALWVAQFTIKD
jgi:hypothetical protein